MVAVIVMLCKYSVISLPELSRPVSIQSMGRAQSRRGLENQFGLANLKEDLR